MSDNIYGALGNSESSYAVFETQFDSSLLHTIPRRLLRDRWNITGNEFVGWDVWHCYESTFLLNNGLPIAGTLKFVYSASSDFVVESKSMKLYLNSFDMCKMGDEVGSATRAYVAQIKQDLESILECNVRICFFDSIDYYTMEFPSVLDNSLDIFTTYYPDLLKLTFDDYTSQNNYIELVDKPYPCRYNTNILRSRCRHTKQKDTGTAILYHEPTQDSGKIDPVSFMKQVISLRELDEFHEFCAERLFVQCKSVIGDSDELLLALMYARRGSLDINPVRTSLSCRSYSEIESFITATTLTQPVFGS